MPRVRKQVRKLEEARRAKLGLPPPVQPVVTPHVETSRKRKAAEESNIGVTKVVPKKAAIVIHGGSFAGSSSGGVTYTSSSGTVPKLSRSASEQKIELTEFDNNIIFDDKTNVLINMECLSNLVSVLQCNDCQGALKVQAFDRNKGIAVGLRLICSKCPAVLNTVLSSPQSRQKNVELNERTASAFMAMGLGCAAAETYAMHMNTPALQKKAFIRNCKHVASKMRKTTEACLVKARQTVRSVHIKRNPLLVKQEILDISVSFDGSWQKRGHRSLYGFAAVIEAETGLAIDYVTLSKFCIQCAIMHSQVNDKEQFRIWHDTHKDKCDINYDVNSPSGNMEVEAATRLWLR